MSLSLSSDSRCRSWATTRFAIVSSTASPRNTIRSLSRREKMSNERSPRADVSITIGTRAIRTFLLKQGRAASVARGSGAKGAARAGQEPRPRHPRAGRASRGVAGSHGALRRARARAHCPPQRRAANRLLHLDRHVHVRCVDRAHDRVRALLLEGVLEGALLARAGAEVRRAVGDRHVVPLLALPDPRDLRALRDRQLLRREEVVLHEHRLAGARAERRNRRRPAPDSQDGHTENEPPHLTRKLPRMKGWIRQK